MLQAHLLVLDISPKNSLGSQAVDVLASCRKPNLQIQYEEVCRSYQAIADFRAKLIGLLPLASGAGIFLLLNDALVFA